MFLVALLFTAMGTMIASLLDDMHGFQLIMNFLIMPLFFLSGALFPLESAPQFLKTISLLDPLTYGVSGLRFLLLGTADIPFAVSLAVIGAFTAAFVIIAAFLFNRIEG